MILSLSKVPLAKHPTANCRSNARTRGTEAPTEVQGLFRGDVRFFNHCGIFINAYSRGTQSAKLNFFEEYPRVDQCARSYEEACSGVYEPRRDLL